MFMNILKVRLKVLLRQKQNFFWGILFPIFLSTFLYLGSGIVPTNSAHYIEETTKVASTYVVERLLDPYSESHYSIYFIAIIALDCYMIGFTGLQETTNHMLRLSPRAKRHYMAPVKSVINVLSGIVVCWLISIVGLSILLVYMKGILGLKLAGSISGWALVIGLGALTGILIDMIIGAIGDYKYAIKQGFIAVISVSSCILAGLIDPAIKFYMDVRLPILSKMNPSAVIVDALYTLNVYGMTRRFYTNILELVLMNIIGGAVLILLLRRNRL